MQYVPPFGATDPDQPYVNAGQNTPGSNPPADAFNATLWELHNAILAGGLIPDPNMFNQLAGIISTMRKDISNAATAGAIIGSFWFGKTKSATVVPNPTSTSQNYFDFTTNTPYTAMSNLTGWTAGSPITPPNDHDARILITSRFWDIVETANFGGTAYWAYSSESWSFFPTTQHIADSEIPGIVRVGIGSDFDTDPDTGDIYVPDSKGFNLWNRITALFTGPQKDQIKQNLGIVNGVIDIGILVNSLTDFYPGKIFNSIIIEAGMMYLCNQNSNTPGTVLSEWPGSICYDINNPTGSNWGGGYYLLRFLPTSDNPEIGTVEVKNIATGQIARANKLSSNTWANNATNATVGPSTFRWWIDNAVYASGLLNGTVMSNGSYKKYTNGKIEQKGRTTGTATTNNRVVPLMIPMPNNTYYANANGFDNANNALYSTRVVDPTTTSISIVNNYINISGGSITQSASSVAWEVSNL